MNRIFKGYIRKFLLIFFDDILVYNLTVDEHNEHLRIMLEILNKESLYANCKKYVFGQKKMKYLGYINLKNRIAANESKVRAGWIGLNLRL